MNAQPSPEACVYGSILYGADELVADFIAKRIPQLQGARFGERNPVTGALPFVALGVVRAGKLVGGTVFHNFRSSHGKMIDVEVSAAFEPSDWSRPSTLKQLLRYPFITAGCIRLTTITGRRNKRARKFIKGIGFTLEGVARKAIDGREDAMIYGMLKSECRWIKGLT